MAIDKCSPMSLRTQQSTTVAIDPLPHTSYSYHYTIRSLMTKCTMLLFRFISINLVLSIYKKKFNY
jgi:hypothetical protein